jgi:predicted house-cleaning noncanonical NTP pyrophosphatase (MazG superfamily)
LKRALSGLPAEDGADSVIQDIEKSTFDDVYGIVMKDPVRYISQKGFIYVRESGSKKFFEIAPYLWSELTRDDVKYILNVVEHKLELYFLRRVNKEEKITHHNKLVRDLIPDIINASGRTCEIEFLEQRVYMEELRLKLQEEVAEYLNDSNLEELADVLEVLHALTKAHGCSWEELERVRAEKKSSRGGFEKKIFLKSVKQI